MTRDDVRAKAAGRGLRRADALLALALAAVALGAFWLMRGAPAALAEDGGEAGGWAVVQNAEGFSQALPLSEDARIEVACAEGWNAVTVSGGAVSVEEADCKNQVCVQTGAVSRPGDMVVCLPHRLVVQVVERPEDAAPLEGALP